MQFCILLPADLTLLVFSKKWLWATTKLHYYQNEMQ